jgi:hypothetical protein
VKELKAFQPGAGFQLDGDFATHTSHCADCRQFDADKPATAALMCLEGSVLYKRDNPDRRTRSEAQRDDNYATKAQIKAAMRYKGE